MSVTDGLGQLIHVLSLALRDKYRLSASKPSEVTAPDVQPRVHKYPLAWAETARNGTGQTETSGRHQTKGRGNSCEGETAPYEPGSSAGDHSPHSTAHG